MALRKFGKRCANEGGYDVALLRTGKNPLFYDSFIGAVLLFVLLFVVFSIIDML